MNRRKLIKRQTEIRRGEVRGRKERPRQTIERLGDKNSARMRGFEWEKVCFRDVIIMFQERRSLVPYILRIQVQIPIMEYKLHRRRRKVAFHLYDVFN